MSYILPNPPLYIDRQAGATSPEYTGEALRTALAGLLVPENGSSSVARSGALSADAMRITSSGIALRANAGQYAIGTAKGVYIMGLNSQVAVDSINPADATNPRIDRVVLRVDDPSNSGMTSRIGTIEYLPGTPAASPTMPTPAGTAVWEHLARIDVPRSGAGAPVVTDGRVFTAATGGVVPIRSSSEITGVNNVDGQLVYDMQADRLMVRQASSWRRVVVEMPEDDTGWVSLPNPPSGWTTQDNPAVRIKNGIVYFRGYLVNTSFSGGFTTLMTLASKYRPSRTVVQPVGGNTAIHQAIQITPAGQLQIYYSATSGAWAALSPISYPLG